VRIPPASQSSTRRCSTSSCRKCRRVAPGQSPPSNWRSQLHQDSETCSSVCCSSESCYHCTAHLHWPVLDSCMYAIGHHLRRWMNIRSTVTSYRSRLQLVVLTWRAPCTCLRSILSCTCTARSEEERSRLPVVRLRTLPCLHPGSCCMDYPDSAARGSRCGAAAEAADQAAPVRWVPLAPSAHSATGAGCATKALLPARS